MKKSDLKTGMFVETREEEKYIVLLNTVEGDRLINTKDGGCLSLEEYNEDLTYNENKDFDYKCFDVMKIYSNDCTSSAIIDITNISKGRAWYKPQELIWERKPEKMQIRIKAEIENIEGIKDIISDLEERLSNLKIKLSL